MPESYYGPRTISFTVNTSEEEINYHIAGLPEEVRRQFFALLDHLDEEGLITMYKTQSGSTWVPETIPYMK